MKYIDLSIMILIVLACASVFRTPQVHTQTQKMVPLPESMWDTWAEWSDLDGTTMTIEPIPPNSKLDKNAIQIQYIDVSEKEYKRMTDWWNLQHSKTPETF